MDKDTSEISKLTERISRDPRSKLFVPLAEEYKKAGDIEMSIHVLTEGLKNNPGYITAKSLLGRLLYDKGDMPGAQKELEEVVKAIPDNLIAQRKLGDIYALTGRRPDALKHFKMAISLNPKDAELASIISDIEAGRDISNKIVKPKPQPAPAAEVQKPAAATQAQAAPLKAETIKMPGAAAQSAQPKVQGIKSQPAAPVQVMQGETAEEVLAVEPLEPALSGVPEPAEAFDFLSEKEQAAPAVSEEPSSGMFAMPGAAEFKTPVEQAPKPAPRQPEAAPAPKGADDFSTNTLAELYLAQGFYDKAAEIYERMLADNPDSEGLKNKLRQVNDLAGAASPAAEGTKAEAGPVPSLDMPVETGFGAGPAEEEIRAFAPPPAYEFIPPAEAASSSEEIKTEPAPFEAPQEPSLDLPGAVEFAPASEHKPGHNIDSFIPPTGEAGFAPMEYKPSYAQETPAVPGPKPAGRKQETVGRLENWLKNIRKEK